VRQQKLLQKFNSLREQSARYNIVVSKTAERTREELNICNLSGIIVDYK
jgi:hypothetical protein